MSLFIRGKRGEKERQRKRKTVSTRERRDLESRLLDGIIISLKGSGGDRPHRKSSLASL